MFGFLKKNDTAAPAAESPASRPGWTDRLKAGLARTRSQLTSLFRRGKIDDELLEDLEATLLMADVGLEASRFLLDELKRRVKNDKLETPAQLQAALADTLEQLLRPLQIPLDTTTHKPFVIMLAGVNGAGKTTSIGKLAKHFQAQGKSVLLAAGDTFRAAAREQLITWGERNNVAVIAQASGDPAAVVFDAINAAKARDIDIVLADTAGRLPTQLHLMEEIAKVKRVIQKIDPTAPHEVLLVLDANIGQNSTAPPRVASLPPSPASVTDSRRWPCVSSASAKVSTICNLSWHANSLLRYSNPTRHDPLRARYTTLSSRHRRAAGCQL
jgi:fused signal recognition particle receptor